MTTIRLEKAMIEFDIATLSELRAEDALQDYYDNIAEELKIEEEFKMSEELRMASDPGIIEDIGPVYYGELEALSHQELIYMYQQLSIEYERVTNV
jgi:hypothetical protein